MQSMDVMSLTLMELGAIIFGLAIVARVASRLGVSAIPFYLMLGLAVGNNSLVPLSFSEDFVRLGAEIGVILLLFTMGLEYSCERLRDSLRHNLLASIADLVLNFPPGFLVGLMLGWSFLASILLGGITYISSSGIIAKMLTDLGWMENEETPMVLSILVLEDIAMALFLPLVTIFLVGQGVLSSLSSIPVAIVAGGGMFFVAMRYGKVLSRFITHSSDEIVLLTTLGLALLVAGVAERLQLSAAVGAFLVGITLSDTVAERTHRLMHPLTDWFAALFFLFFGLGIELNTLPPVALPALGLVLVTALTKILTAWWSTRDLGLVPSQRLCAGVTLIARGEFSLVIAALGVSAGVESQLGAMAAAYVLFSALLGTVLTQAMEPLLAPVEQEEALAEQTEKAHVPSH
ncbi:MAG: cation:proton antiporter [Anaerolineales bacterium]